MKTIAYNEVLFRAAEAAGRTRDNLPLEEAALLKSVFALELSRIWASEDWDDLRQPLLAVALDGSKSFANPYAAAITSQIIVADAGSTEQNGTYYLDSVSGRWYLQNPVGTNLGPYIVVDGTGAASLNNAFDAVYYTAPAAVSLTWTAAAGQAPAPTSTNPSTSTPLGEVLGVFDQLPTGGTPWQRIDYFRTGDTFTVTPSLNQPNRYAGNVPATVYVYWQTPAPDLLAMSAAQLTALTLPLVFGNYLALLGAGHLLTADGAASLAGMQIGLARSDLDFQRTLIKRPPWTKQ